MELFSGAISTISPLTLLPGNCSLCLQPIQPQNHCLCNLCISELPWLKTQCQRCATPLNHNNLCPECQQNLPPFRRCVAAFEYQKGAIDKLILDIKTNPRYPIIQFIILCYLSSVSKFSYANYYDSSATALAKTAYAWL